MRSIYWVCAVCAMLAMGLLMARQAETEAPKKITYEELVKLLEKPQDVLLIDVREPNEIEVTGTLKGALTIPVGQLADRPTRLVLEPADLLKPRHRRPPLQIQPRADHNTYNTTATSNASS